MTCDNFILFFFKEQAAFWMERVHSWAALWLPAEKSHRSLLFFHAKAILIFTENMIMSDMIWLCYIYFIFARKKDLFRRESITSFNF